MRRVSRRLSNKGINLTKLGLFVLEGPAVMSPEQAVFIEARFAAQAPVFGGYHRHPASLSMAMTVTACAAIRRGKPAAASGPFTDSL
jgi:hypothetical protein